MPTTDTHEAMGGEGSDASMDRRPGVPMEMDPPRPMGHAHWKEPEHQRDPGYVLKRRELDALTPVFGTAVPPRGVSGMLRRAAYGIAEHRASHWLLLLLADRVDVIEHRVERALPFAAPVLVGGVALLALRRMRQRRVVWFG